MNEQFYYFTVVSPTKAVGKIVGDIGCDVIGTAFAQEFKTLEGQGINEFDIRILSYGGSVFDGMIIASTLVESKSKITTYNDGVAASTASWLFLCGQEWVMKDCAIMMMHNPYCFDTSPKAQEATTLFKNYIVTFVAGRTGIEAKKVSKMMDAETWMDAQEAYLQGLVTRIEKTGERLVVSTENKSPKEMFNIYNSMNPEIKNEETVAPEVTTDEVAEVTTETVTPEVKTTDEPVTTETPEEAPTTATVEPQEEPSVISDEVKDAEKEALIAQNEQLVKENKEVLERLSQMETQLNAYVEAEAKKVADARRLEITNFVKTAVADGKLTVEMEEHWVNLADKDFDTVKKSLGALPSVKRAVKVMDSIKPVETQVENLMGLREMEKKNPEELKRIRNTSPALYAEMYFKEYGVTFRG